MKKTPYTVPEGSFDSARAAIMARTGAIRRRRNAYAWIAAAAASLALVLAIPGLTSSSADGLEWMGSDEIELTAELYDYDIFLETL